MPYLVAYSVIGSHLVSTGEFEDEDDKVTKINLPLMPSREGIHQEDCQSCSSATPQSDNIPDRPTYPVAPL